MPSRVGAGHDEALVMQTAQSFVGELEWSRGAVCAQSPVSSLQPNSGSWVPLHGDPRQRSQGASWILFCLGGRM